MPGRSKRPPNQHRIELRLVSAQNNQRRYETERTNAGKQKIPNDVKPQSKKKGVFRFYGCLGLPTKMF
jgi:hypothetical protein